MTGDQEMEGRRWIGRHRFWLLALLWLPSGVAVQAAVQAAVRFLPGPGPEPGMWLVSAVMAVASLAMVAPCGLPLALGCRRLWRLRYRRAAWLTGIVLGAV